MIDDKLHKGTNAELFYFARQNRKAMTGAEKMLWNCLRNRKLKGFKFRRQHPISHFIADFFCLDCNLIIEIDGKYHLDAEQHLYDEGRTYELEGLNIKVMRFTNDEVIEKIDYVLREIEKWLVANTPHP